MICFICCYFLIQWARFWTVGLKGGPIPSPGAGVSRYWDRRCSLQMLSRTPCPDFTCQNGGKEKQRKADVYRFRWMLLISWEMVLLLNIRCDGHSSPGTTFWRLLVGLSWLCTALWQRDLLFMECKSFRPTDCILPPWCSKL